MKNFLFLMVITLTAGIFLLYSSLAVNRSIANKIVRLHVIANSNSDQDQLLKLKVRDAVIKEASSFRSEANVKKQLNHLKKVAENEIARNGYDYTAKVEYGSFYFPTKHYLNYSLPNGNYNAVKISIGKSKGKNWWCVLYPPLCFVKGTAKEISSKNLLKSRLNSKEMDFVTSQSSTSKPKVCLQFKAVELYNKIFKKTPDKEKNKNENANTKSSSGKNRQIKPSYS